MRRREFISLMGGAAAAWPLAAEAQQTPTPVIGFLHGASANTYALFVAEFIRGLRQAGYADGKNVRIEYRWADGRYERLPQMANELVSQHVAVIATPGSTPATLAAKAATSSIPIVFFVAGNPIELGLVSNLGHPNSNLTGVTGLNEEVGPKRLELLHELVPKVKSFAVLVNPTSPAQADPQLRELEPAAAKLGLQLHILRASTESEIEGAFAALVQAGAGGLIIGPDAYFNTRYDQLAALALRHMVPTIYQYREFTAAGGLLSYGANLAEVFRLSGLYTARILKGEKVADLPVQQATKVELVINLKTAKALSIDVPLSLLGRADEVIE
ncbi:MAG TPA: ABC transporter substrate-binding protein [Xanthobacteraceae bacterium]|jgi:putative ABC transport system substrate-binding protein|nr:ABC transporter substrate-binding protein [Xanthobacteraceae bacterium]